jgi:transposase-like protein
VGVRVERESGKTFLVPVPDRTADTLMAVISDWIEPGNTVIGDCWSAYRDIETHSYTHQTANHTIGFVDERTGAHANTTESTKRHVMAFLNPYNRVDDHICHLAHYMFVAGCLSVNVDQFTKFIGIVASMDWSASIGPDPGTVK